MHTTNAWSFSLAVRHYDFAMQSFNREAFDIEIQDNDSFFSFAAQEAASFNKGKQETQTKLLFNA
ncbi:hypothetical protein HYALB_00012894 [Hymenoscyphus albidus]|uniref:Uncharacterized protein n=1 Tax=Hymenoscyphus albidus TaxID=595503 RepID=A0A9N9LRI3_9HELO|nr:hypothetical protein HYALB_00012894 [Hymenoscyphus albidus]